MKRLIIFLGMIPMLSMAQSSKIPFIDHLVKKGYFEEALYEIGQQSVASLSSSQKDSVYFLRGWSLYRLKELKQSAESLEKVSDSFPEYLKATYFAAYNHTFEGDYSRAKNILKRGKEKTNIYHFQSAGIALLEKDFSAFQSCFAQIDTTYFPIHTEAKHLDYFAHALQNHHAKSPTKAGLLSAVVPGLGKWYVGKKGQAISSFITVTGLGLVTLENYHKRGATDYRTIVFGALFAIFYTGNIYGSVYTARITEQEYQHEIRNKILFDLHIPLRNIFNE